jgi:hypothetical protein
MVAPMPWLAEGFSHPERLDLPTGHHLRPIRESDTDIDYPAVMTYEADRKDLARHEREIAAHETFNYAVLDEGETELLGCVYIDPPDEDTPEGTDALVSWWVVDDEADGELERALDELVPRWLAERWGFRAVHYAP